MKKFILSLFFPMLSFAIVPAGKYQSCLNASNKLESPADRDAEKINCFNRFSRSAALPVQKTISVCVDLARVLEHTTASDSLIVSCLSDSILEIKLADCVTVAKKLNYSENRDKALWMCIENKSMKRSKCKDITDEMTFPHNKSVSLNYCLMKN